MSMWKNWKYGAYILYNCEKLNNEKSKVKFIKIYEGNVHEMKQIVKRFKHNFNKRNQEYPCDPDLWSTNLSLSLVMDK